MSGSRRGALPQPRLARWALGSPVEMGTHYNVGPLQLDADARVLIHEGAGGRLIQ
jgi:hypothetical protein